MPSRTYIQMLLGLHNNSRLFLTQESLRELNKYNAALEKHPEAIEKIVQRRANMVKYAKYVRQNIDIFAVHMVMFEEIIMDSMFMAELIELPKLNNFDTTPNYIPNFSRIAMGFQPVVSNAVVVMDEEAFK